MMMLRALPLLLAFPLLAGCSDDPEPKPDDPGEPTKPAYEVLETGRALVNPSRIATDGKHLFYGDADPHWAIWSVPINGGQGGKSILLYTSPGPGQMLVIGKELFWIDPNSGPDRDTQILRAPKQGGGPVRPIYKGSERGQPIVDGSGLTTDGRRLYSADMVQGRVHTLRLDGRGLNQLGPKRYQGFFETGHPNTIAQSEGKLFVVSSGRKNVMLPQVAVIPTRGGASFSVLHSGKPFVTPVDVAVGRGVIFVADAGANVVWRLPVDGGTPKPAFTEPKLVGLTSIALIRDTLFVVDAGRTSPKAEPDGKIYRLKVF